MRFGRGACSARPVTSIGDPLNRTVMLCIDQGKCYVKAC